MSVEIHPFHQLFISLVLGLLVGLQRQWVDAPLGGVRTFTLLSIFGTLCAFIANSFGVWIIVSGFLGVISVILVGNFSHKKNFDAKKHSPLSTEVAMLVMFAVGVLAATGPLWLAASAAGILVIILQLKMPLHRLMERFNEDEIKAFIQFILISLIILPILPDRTMGPFDVLNPFEIWLMVILIVAISLTGYILYKFLGGRVGTWMSGILGGVISSTATTVSYSKRCKTQAEAVSSSAIVISLAWTTVYIRLIIEVAVVAPSFKSIYLPLIILAAVSFLTTLFLWKRTKVRSEWMPIQQNPSELKSALIFAFLFAMILILTEAAKQHFGNWGLLAAAFLSGLTDVDAITLSTSRLVESKRLLSHEGSAVILMGIFSNLLFKIGIAASLGGKKLLKALLIPFSTTLITMILLFFLR